MNSFINDIFEKIAGEASKLAKTQAYRHLKEIQTAVGLILPGELAKHAVSEGTKPSPSTPLLQSVVCVRPSTSSPHKKERENQKSIPRNQSVFNTTNTSVFTTTTTKPCLLCRDRGRTAGISLIVPPLFAGAGGAVRAPALLTVTFPSTAHLCPLPRKAGKTFHESARWFPPAHSFHARRKLLLELFSPHQPDRVRLAI